MEEMKKYNVIISDEAVKMLEQHAAFLANVNRKASDKFIADFAKAVESLSILPERCPWMNQPYIPYRKYKQLLFSRRYLLIYTIRNKNVYVDYVIETRQHYTWLTD